MSAPDRPADGNVGLPFQVLGASTLFVHHYIIMMSTLPHLDGLRVGLKAYRPSPCILDTRIAVDAPQAIEEFSRQGPALYAISPIA